MRTSHWSELGPDPNIAATVSWRAETLGRAWRAVDLASGDRRLETLAAYAKGRRTLDVGCVDHFAAQVSLENPRWLHARLIKEASMVVGVDIDQLGVDQMTSMGLTAVSHDVTAGPGPLVEYAPFETVVAGEVIEHLADPQSLLATAFELLMPEGVFVLSTPNPYAPWRVRAGQLRRPYESVDHVAYLFPVKDQRNSPPSIMRIPHLLVAR